MNELSGAAHQQGKKRIPYKSMHSLLQKKDPKYRFQLEISGYQVLSYRKTTN